ncbi:MAG: DUF362 domain-containing protein [Elusimicrobia bacterium]|nr:DUF362 domain-containing protein [Candidatus Liberimonas magnetica]
MSSNVYFLQWEQVDKLGEWLKSTGLFKKIRNRDFTALKIHFGEKGNKGYIKPEYAKTVVDKVKLQCALPFLTDASTIYVGERADAVHHLTVANKHGFSIENCGCPVIISDGLRGNAGVEVEVNLKHFKHVSISNAIYYSDFIIFLNHFKGHEISGFGGVLKNMGMGCGTRSGKYSMHDKVHPKTIYDRCIGCGNCLKWCSACALHLKNKKISLDDKKCVGCGECILSCPQGVFQIPWDENTSAAQEKIVEYAYGVVKNKPNFGINFLNFITKFCDCYRTKEDPLLKDIGVLASDDPVALDQASADMVNKAFGSDFFKFIFPQIDWEVQLNYAEKLGLGSRQYKVINF